MSCVNFSNLKYFLNQKVDLYNCESFIVNDPISVPHQFKQKEDIEIIGFFAAIFAWGQRQTIINKCMELAERMDNSPYSFVVGHQGSDLKKLLGFSIGHLMILICFIVWNSLNSIIKIIFLSSQLFFRRRI